MDVIELTYIVRNSMCKNSRHERKSSNIAAQLNTSITGEKLSLTHALIQKSNGGRCRLEHSINDRHIFKAR